MKKFIVLIPNEVNNEGLEEFLQCKLHMTFREMGIGNVKYYSDRPPRKFKEKILERFGSYTWESIFIGREEIWK